MKIENQMTYLWYWHIEYDNTFIDIPNEYILNIIWKDMWEFSIGYVSLN